MRAYLKLSIKIVRLVELVAVVAINRSCFLTDLQTLLLLRLFHNNAYLTCNFVKNYFVGIVTSDTFDKYVTDKKIK